MCIPFSRIQSGNGPIDAPKTVADVKKEPYALPAK